MKIIKITILTLLVVILLSSCLPLKYEEIEDVTPVAETPITEMPTTEAPDKNIFDSSVNWEQLELLDLNLDGDILLFYDRNIYYQLTDPTSSNPENPNKTLCAYSLDTNEISELVYFKSPKTGRDSMTIHENNLYMTCDDDGGNRILIEFDLISREAKIIRKWEDDTLFSSIYSTDEKLILFNINIKDDESFATEYVVELIDPISYDKTYLFREIARETSGTACSCVAFDENYIYLYILSIADKSESYSIAVYDNDGNNVRDMPLDLNEFLAGAGEIKGDTVFDFYKKGDYFIFNTINARNSIWRADGKKEIMPVEIPKDLYPNVPDGYNVIDFLGYSDNAYFIASFRSNQMFVFDVDSGCFKSISLPFDKKSCIYWYYRDENGDLLITEKDIYTDEKNFYLLKAEQIY